MDDEFDCPDCGGTGEVQCINLRDGESDYLPCPTCIAHERNECEELLRAENAKLSGLNAQYLAALETFEAMMSNPKYDAGEVLEEFATITRAALKEGEKSA